MTDLYSADPSERRSAARPYRPTPKSPSYWGEQWPEALIEQVKDWPYHLIGSANAWLVYVAPNPGPRDENRVRPAFIEPVEPTLGANPHPHVALGGFQHRSWTILRKLVSVGFAGVLDQSEALASFMLANVSSRHSARSVWGETYGEWDWSRIVRALRLTRPRLVVAQNREIYDMLCVKLTPVGGEDTIVSGTERRLSRRRRVVVLDGSQMLLAEAESHFTQGTSFWSEQTYLPLLTREALALP